jgi:ubiquinone/menaquinone biosynthesis C-methylase UbiE
MGFYGKHILPHLIDLAMQNREQARLRKEWVPRATGKVLEVGIGSGLNLAFYSDAVHNVSGVDCSAELLQKVGKRTRNLSFPVELVRQSVEEELPFPDASMDTVVMTWVLCSIADPLRALSEIRRVLKAEGRLIFLEHGHAPESGVARWQDRLTPTWKHIAGGCTLNRKIDDLLISAGLRITELSNEYMEGPRPMTYMYKGVASPG